MTCEKRIRVLMLLAAVCSAAQEIRMENGRLVISDWNPAATLTVYAGAGDVPPVMGTSEVTDGRLVFKPRFPLASGLTIRAVVSEPGKQIRESSLKIPDRAPMGASRVVQIYPSVDTLPANQLKLYIEFSAPMARGEAWKRVHLLNDKEERIEVPFLEIEQELWDPEGTRLTVLFDPGRIKRGLESLEEEGPALEEGRTYSVVVDAGWRDVNGTPLEQAFRKQFLVGPADRIPPEVKTWRIIEPAAGTRAPVIVRFPEPMDSALLLRLLQVDGIEGTAALGTGEMEWRFTPDAPWKATTYQLEADTWLEDLAGNRLGRPFDLDTFKRVTKRVERKTELIPFRIAPK
jgi:hypothetical protein